MVKFAAGLPTTLLMRALRLAGSVAAGLVLSSSLAVPAAASAADTPAATRRAALLLRIAAVTDTAERAQAEVVRAQFAVARAHGQVASARTRARRHVVAAYMRGGGTRPAHADGGRAAVYARVALRLRRQAVTVLAAAAGAAARAQRAAEADRDRERSVTAELADLREQLDREVAAEEAARARDAQLRAADAARRAAMTAAARRPYSPSPLDPAALTPRHRRATQAQIELMARYPFGPLTPGQPLPGLRTTGQTLDGVASWYGPGFNGRATASGAIYDQEGWTVASKELPLGTMLVVTRGDRRVLLLVNDRGPYVDGRILDLSHAAAVYLGIGLGRVTAEVVAPG